MALPDRKSHRVALDEAAAQAKRARDGGIKGGYFHRKDLDDLLAQPGCVGIRYYYGRKGDGQDTLIVVGVDTAGDDIAKGVVMEDSFLCPPICGSANALNS
jgi:hypothetical protein